MRFEIFTAVKIWVIVLHLWYCVVW